MSASSLSRRRDCLSAVRKRDDSCAFQRTPVACCSPYPYDATCPSFSVSPSPPSQCHRHALNSSGGPPPFTSSGYSSHGHKAAFHLGGDGVYTLQSAGPLDSPFATTASYYPPPPGARAPQGGSSRMGSSAAPFPSSDSRVSSFASSALPAASWGRRQGERCSRVSSRIPGGEFTAFCTLFPEEEEPVALERRRAARAESLRRSESARLCGSFNDAPAAPSFVETDSERFSFRPPQGARASFVSLELDPYSKAWHSRKPNARTSQLSDRDLRAAVETDAPPLAGLQATDRGKSRPRATGPAETGVPFQGPHCATASPADDRPLREPQATSRAFRDSECLFAHEAGEHETFSPQASLRFECGGRGLGPNEEEAYAWGARFRNGAAGVRDEFAPLPAGGERDDLATAHRRESRRRSLPSQSWIASHGHPAHCCRDLPAYSSAYASASLRAAGPGGCAGASSPSAEGVAADRAFPASLSPTRSLRCSSSCCSSRTLATGLCTPRQLGGRDGGQGRRIVGEGPHEPASSGRFGERERAATQGRTREAGGGRGAETLNCASGIPRSRGLFVARRHGDEAEGRDRNDRETNVSLPPFLARGARATAEQLHMRREDRRVSSLCSTGRPQRGLAAEEARDAPRQEPRPDSYTCAVFSGDSLAYAPPLSHEERDGSRRHRKGHLGPGPQAPSRRYEGPFSSGASQLPVSPFVPPCPSSARSPVAFAFPEGERLPARASATLRSPERRQEAPVRAPLPRALLGGEPEAGAREREARRSREGRSGEHVSASAVFSPFLGAKTSAGTGTKIVKGRSFRVAHRKQDLSVGPGDCGAGLFRGAAGGDDAHTHRGSEDRAMARTGPATGARGETKASSPRYETQRPAAARWGESERPERQQRTEREERGRDAARRPDGEEDFSRHPADDDVSAKSLAQSTGSLRRSEARDQPLSTRPQLRRQPHDHSVGSPASLPRRDELRLSSEASPSPRRVGPSASSPQRANRPPLFSASSPSSQPSSPGLPRGSSAPVRPCPSRFSQRGHADASPSASAFHASAAALMEEVNLFETEANVDELRALQDTVGLHLRDSLRQQIAALESIQHAGRAAAPAPPSPGASPRSPAPAAGLSAGPEGAGGGAEARETGEGAVARGDAEARIAACVEYLKSQVQKEERRQRALLAKQKMLEEEEERQRETWRKTMEDAANRRAKAVADGVERAGSHCGKGRLRAGEEEKGTRKVLARRFQQTDTDAEGRDAARQPQPRQRPSPSSSRLSPGSATSPSSSAGPLGARETLALSDCRSLSALTPLHPSERPQVAASGGRTADEKARLRRRRASLGDVGDVQRSRDACVETDGAFAQDFARARESRAEHRNLTRLLALKAERLRMERERFALEEKSAYILSQRLDEWREAGTPNDAHMRDGQVNRQERLADFRDEEGLLRRDQRADAAKAADATTRSPLHGTTGPFSPATAREETLACASARQRAWDKMASEVPGFQEEAQESLLRFRESREASARSPVRVRQGGQTPPGVQSASTASALARKTGRRSLVESQRLARQRLAARKRREEEAAKATEAELARRKQNLVKLSEKTRKLVQRQLQASRARASGPRRRATIGATDSQRGSPPTDAPAEAATPAAAAAGGGRAPPVARGLPSPPSQLRSTTPSAAARGSLDGRRREAEAPQGVSAAASGRRSALGEKARVAPAASSAPPRAADDGEAGAEGARALALSSRARKSIGEDSRGADRAAPRREGAAASTSRSLRRCRSQPPAGWLAGERGESEESAEDAPSYSRVGPCFNSPSQVRPLFPPAFGPGAEKATSDRCSVGSLYCAPAFSLFPPGCCPFCVPRALRPSAVPSHLSAQATPGRAEAALPVREPRDARPRPLLPHSSPSAPPPPPPVSGSAAATRVVLLAPVHALGLDGKPAAHSSAADADAFFSARPHPASCLCGRGPARWAPAGPPPPSPLGATTPAGGDGGPVAPGGKSREKERGEQREGGPEQVKEVADIQREFPHRRERAEALIPPGQDNLLKAVAERRCHTAACEGSTTLAAGSWTRPRSAGQASRSSCDEEGESEDPRDRLEREMMRRLLAKQGKLSSPSSSCGGLRASVGAGGGEGVHAGRRAGSPSWGPREQKEEGEIEQDVSRSQLFVACPPSSLAQDESEAGPSGRSHYRQSGAESEGAPAPSPKSERCMDVRVTAGAGASTCEVLDAAISPVLVLRPSAALGATGEETHTRDTTAACARWRRRDGEDSAHSFSPRRRELPQPRASPASLEGRVAARLDRALSPVLVVSPRSSPRRAPALSRGRGSHTRSRSSPCFRDAARGISPPPSQTTRLSVGASSLAAGGPPAGASASLPSGAQGSTGRGDTGPTRGGNTGSDSSPARSLLRSPRELSDGTVSVQQMQKRRLSPVPRAHSPTEQGQSPRRGLQEPDTTERGRRGSASAPAEAEAKDSSRNFCPEEGLVKTVLAGLYNVIREHQADASAARLEVSQNAQGAEEELDGAWDAILRSLARYRERRLPRGLQRSQATAGGSPLGEPVVASGGDRETQQRKDAREMERLFPAALRREQDSRFSRAAASPRRGEVADSSRSNEPPLSPCPHPTSSLSLAAGVLSSPVSARPASPLNFLSSSLPGPGEPVDGEKAPARRKLPAPLQPGALQSPRSPRPARHFAWSPTSGVPATADAETERVHTPPRGKHSRVSSRFASAVDQKVFIGVVVEQVMARLKRERLDLYRRRDGRSPHRERDCRDAQDDAPVRSPLAGVSVALDVSRTSAHSSELEEGEIREASRAGLTATPPRPDVVPPLRSPPSVSSPSRQLGVARLSAKSSPPGVAQARSDEGARPLSPSVSSASQVETEAGAQRDGAPERRLLYSPTSCSAFFPSSRSPRSRVHEGNRGEALPPSPASVPVSPSPSRRRRGDAAAVCCALSVYSSPRFDAAKAEEGTARGASSPESPGGPALQAGEPGAHRTSPSSAPVSPSGRHQEEDTSPRGARPQAIFNQPLHPRSASPSPERGDEGRSLRSPAAVSASPSCRSPLAASRSEATGAPQLRLLSPRSASPASPRPSSPLCGREKTRKGSLSPVRGVHRRTEEGGRGVLGLEEATSPSLSPSARENRGRTEERVPASPRSCRASPRPSRRLATQAAETLAPETHQREEGSAAAAALPQRGRLEAPEGNFGARSPSPALSAGEENGLLSPSAGVPPAKRRELLRRVAANHELLAADAAPLSPSCISAYSVVAKDAEAQAEAAPRNRLSPSSQLGASAGELGNADASGARTLLQRDDVEEGEVLEVTAGEAVLLAVGGPEKQPLAPSLPASPQGCAVSQEERILEARGGVPARTEGLLAEDREGGLHMLPPQAAEAPHSLSSPSIASPKRKCETLDHISAEKASEEASPTPLSPVLSGDSPRAVAAAPIARSPHEVEEALFANDAISGGPRLSAPAVVRPEDDSEVVEEEETLVSSSPPLPAPSPLNVRLDASPAAQEQGESEALEEALERERREENAFYRDAADLCAAVKEGEFALAAVEMDSEDDSSDAEEESEAIGDEILQLNTAALPGRMRKQNKVVDTSPEAAVRIAFALMIVRRGGEILSDHVTPADVRTDESLYQEIHSLVNRCMRENPSAVRISRDFIELILDLIHDVVTDPEHCFVSTNTWQTEEAHQRRELKQSAQSRFRGLAQFFSSKKDETKTFTWKELFEWVYSAASLGFFAPLSASSPTSWHRGLLRDPAFKPLSPEPVGGEDDVMGLAFAHHRGAASYARHLNFVSHALVASPGASAQREGGASSLTATPQPVRGSSEPRPAGRVQGGASREGNEPGREIALEAGDANSSVQRNGAAYRDAREEAASLSTSSVFILPSRPADALPACASDPQEQASCGPLSYGSLRRTRRTEDEEEDLERMRVSSPLSSPSSALCGAPGDVEPTAENGRKLVQARLPPCPFEIPGRDAESPESLASPSSSPASPRSLSSRPRLSSPSSQSPSPRSWESSPPRSPSPSSAASRLGLSSSSCSPPSSGCGSLRRRAAQGNEGPCESFSCAGGDEEEAFGSTGPLPALSHPPYSPTARAVLGGRSQSEQGEEEFPLRSCSESGEETTFDADGGSGAEGIFSSSSSPSALYASSGGEGVPVSALSLPPLPFDPPPLQCSQEARDGSASAFSSPEKAADEATERRDRESTQVETREEAKRFETREGTVLRSAAYRQLSSGEICLEEEGTVSARSVGEVKEKQIFVALGHSRASVPSVSAGHA
ncbi:hypothetical protein BESB_080680 [Besnoitia besnoiti]|uniref:Uncharacterized protein n=1 Tax=Besnoitia besnoiti TaxID=94643 RepID=A0A2A9MEP0_BESBE|nr:hypothetical protein BESB_080680 [Besnoitia besnoiti]PFH33852.1 hypothetical protein BESB_080680 [Besnoitia besnoiti]